MPGNRAGVPFASNWSLAVCVVVLVEVVLVGVEYESGRVLLNTRPRFMHRTPDQSCIGIVFVWSQYDVANIVGGVIPQSNQQEAYKTSSYITSVLMS